jgi:poly-gamma-glutamate synthesis protein (capsule biosynthesis protein)
LFKKSEYVVANLETPTAGEKAGYSCKNYNFNTPETILKAMKDSGIAMVTTANNHSLDRGVSGIDSTIDNIKKYGLEYTGTAQSEIERAPLVKEIKGTKIGFLSYTYGTEACYNGVYLDKKNYYKVNLLQEQELKNPCLRFLIRLRCPVARMLRQLFRIINPHFLNRNVEDFPAKDHAQKSLIIDDINYCKSNKVYMKNIDH